MKLCGLCKRPLDVPGDVTTQDCGGDCLRCMAEVGDPDCRAVMEEVNAAPPVPAWPGEEEIARLRAALASDARVEQILEAVLVSSNDPELGTRDHLPRPLRDFLSEECGRAGKRGFDEGYAEGFAKASAVPPVVTEGWQPIETAPKTGKRVLVCSVKRRGGVLLAYYDADLDEWCEAVTSQGLYERHEYDDRRPTHWMPLPPPPALTAALVKEG